MAEDNLFITVFNSASNLPIVNVNRDDYLRKQFSKKKYNVNEIIKLGPVAAGVPKNEIRKIAKGTIKLETVCVTSISAAAGIPGGLAMIGTVPADIAQYMGYMIRASQKLMYLYGIDDINSMPDGSNSALIIALGVMLSAEAANSGIRVLCKNFAANTEKKLAQRALTKGTLYPIVKKVCKQLGVKLTKEGFAKAAGKVVPLFGAITSGALTLATFVPSCNRLLKELEKEMFD